MRSRSKKGEVGLCCAQPCDRPGPIVIMVLPTVFNRSLISFSRPTACGGRRRVLYRPLARIAEVETSASQGSETIHHNSSSRKAAVTRFCTLAFEEICRANRVPEHVRMALRQTACRIDFGSISPIPLSPMRTCRDRVNLLHIAASIQPQCRCRHRDRWRPSTSHLSLLRSRSHEPHSTSC